MKLIVPSEIIRQYAIVLIVNFSVFTAGLNLAWPSPVLIKLRNATETPLSRPITEEDGSWLVSLGFLCGIIANIIGGMLLDTIGRKYCILLASIPKVLIGLLYIFATEVWMLILGRSILMIGDGFLFTAVPIYASEIATKEQRGALGTLLQICTSLGILISLSVGPFTSYVTFNIIFTVLVAVATVPLLFLPDSPYFLYSKGRVDEARDILTSIRGSEQLVKEEFIEYDNSNQSMEKISKMMILKSKLFQKSLALSFMLSLGSQIIGFNSVSFYLQTVLESTHVSVKPEIASVIMGIIQVFASFCSLGVTNTYGRKTILMWSLSGYFLGMMTLGTFFKITEPEDYIIEGFLNYLPIAAIIVIIFCYSVGIGSLFWLLSAELFDGHSRAFGMSIVVSTATILIFITTKYFIVIINMLGPAITYWIFSTFTILFVASIAVFLPETKGKTFSEIQQALGVKEKCDNSVI